MRTVTFAAEPVKRLLNDSFVCAVTNTTGDPAAGMSLSHAPSDPPGPCLRGSGEHNVQTLVLTAKGELLLVIAGYVDSEELEQELTFALATHKAIQVNPRNAKQIVRDRHIQFLSERGFSKDDLERTSAFPLPDLAGFGQAMSGLSGLANGSFDMGNAFNGFGRQRVLADHRFVIENPLMPIARFRAEDLVGGGASFFGSVSSGSGTANGFGNGTGFGTGNGFGNGTGFGTGNGFGKGSGFGKGTGNGFGKGTGLGSGSGDGSGTGSGFGTSNGFGKGTGLGSGSGDGSGTGFGTSNGPNEDNSSIGSNTSSGTGKTKRTKSRSNR